MTDAPDWDISVGATLDREARRLRYGGAPFGGIEQSAQTPNVFIYSDPSRGVAYGYNFDGWSRDGSVFLYTGEGRKGDQDLTHGNHAILRHREEGRQLRLFVADGFRSGSRAKIQRYIGQFKVDEILPYTRADAPDVDGEMRSVVVFRLRPLGTVLRRREDASTADDVVMVATAQLAEVEAHQAKSYQVVGRSTPTTATRRESELVQRYKRYLEGRGHEVYRWRIRPPGELRDVLTDLYDATANELYEAKGVTTRDAIRHAVGQLFDYRRHIPQESIRLAVLVPSRPSKDLLDFLSELGIGCTYEESPHCFTQCLPSH